ncbi:MAG: hypothetical protein WBV21_04295, partial [Desulfobacterales bacterium]
MVDFTRSPGAHQTPLRIPLPFNAFGVQGVCGMTNFRFYLFKNQMMIGNFLANVIGVSLVNWISQYSMSPPTSEVEAMAARIDVFFMPFSFFFPIAFTWYYERPIRRYLRRVFRTNVSAAEVEQSA